MANHVLSLVFSIALLASSSLSFTLLGSPSFSRIVSKSDNQLFQHSVELPNGDIVFAHSAEDPASFFFTEYHIDIICLDKHGAVKWDKTLKADTIGSIAEMALSQDGNVALLIGGSYPEIASQGLLLLKLDSQGNVIFNKVYYFYVIQSGGDLVATDDGGFVITGRGTIPFTDSNLKVFIAKIDAVGAVEWGVRSDDQSTDLITNEPIVTPQGDVVLGGYVSLSGNFYVKIDSAGSFEWAKSYGHPTDLIHSAELLSLSDGVLWCNSVLNPPSPSYLLFNKIDFQGNIVQSVKYSYGSGYEQAKDMILDGDGNIVVLSFIQPDGGGVNLFSLMKLTLSLEFIAKRIYENDRDASP